MADLLAYWRYDNYKRDLEEGAGFNFNSRQPRLHSAISLGDSLWLITGRQEPGRPGLAYYVVARLVVRSKTLNPPGYKYGSYRIWGVILHAILRIGLTTKAHRGFAAKVHQW